MGEVIKLRRVRETRCYEFASAEKAKTFFEWVLNWGIGRRADITVAHSHRVVDVQTFDRTPIELIDESADAFGGWLA